MRGDQFVGPVVPPVFSNFSSGHPSVYGEPYDFDEHGSSMDAPYWLPSGSHVAHVHCRTRRFAFFCVDGVGVARG